MVEVKEKLKPIVNFMQIWTNILAVKADNIPSVAISLKELLRQLTTVL